MSDGPQASRILTTANGQPISRLGWGTGSGFGYSCDEKAGRRLVEAAFEAELNVVDTGFSYASGRSEILLGKCLRAIGCDRTKLFLSTKIGSFPSKYPGVKTRKDYSAAAVRSSLTTSLSRLGTDYLDVVFFHDIPTAGVPTPTIELLLDLQRSGTIRHVGMSIHNSSLVSRIANDPPGYLDVVMHHYNALNYDKANPAIEALSRHGVAVFGSSPFANGLLSQRARFRSSTALPADIFYLLRSCSPRMRRRRRLAKKAYARLLETHGEQPLLPLKAGLNNPNLACLVSGTLRPSSFDDYGSLLLSSSS